MVPRCGWFVRDNQLYCKVVSIDWELGFNKEAKHEYINRMIEALGDDVGMACDVTSASPNRETQILSPIFVKSRIIADKTIEDWIQEKKIKMIPGTHGYNVASWHYLMSLSEYNLNTVARYNCFFDVFCNYTGEPRNSQAYLLGFLKLLMLTHRLHILETFDKFEEVFLNLKYKEVV